MFCIEHSIVKGIISRFLTEGCVAFVVVRGIPCGSSGISSLTLVTIISKTTRHLLPDIVGCKRHKRPLFGSSIRWCDTDSCSPFFVIFSRSPLRAIHAPLLYASCPMPYNEKEKLLYLRRQGNSVKAHLIQSLKRSSAKKGLQKKNMCSLSGCQWTTEVRDNDKRFSSYLPLWLMSGVERRHATMRRRLG